MLKNLQGVSNVLSFYMKGRFSYFSLCFSIFRFIFPFFCLFSLSLSSSLSLPPIYALPFFRFLSPLFTRTLEFVTALSFFRAQALFTFANFTPLSVFAVLLHDKYVRRVVRRTYSCRRSRIMMTKRGFSSLIMSKLFRTGSESH